jgi:quinoprotein glucose dehydrogenase
MKKFTNLTAFTATILLVVLSFSCGNENEVKDKRIRQIEHQRAAELSKSIAASVNAELAQGLAISLWGVDSLVADPVSIDIDDEGKLYYTRTNRQKNSEFDIRGHQDWEIGSISLKTIEDKSNFLKKVLAPELSSKNTWLPDLNNDGSHDWKDMTVEKEHVYRLEDTNGDGVADLSQLVVEDFYSEVTDAMGTVMKVDDNLFVGIAPDMWRLKDKDGDGIADEKTSISHGYGIHVGFGGHGMSGLEMGPEGKIYWQIGDIGFNGKDANGQELNHSNNGVIVRSNPDGSDFEVFAFGNRNTHEFVFDEYGNLISEDNDGDHAGERERIVYITNGSDTGWRINWQFGKYRDPDNNTYKVWMDEKMYLPRWEGQAAYITPAIANYVSGPTGMLYNPGTALGPEWKNTFFIGEFVGNPARSGVHAFKLKPKGATFELGEEKVFMRGILATGIDFGPDGAMYLADWIDGWNTKEYGRIWKIDVANGADSEIRKETKTLLAASFKEYDEKQLSDLLRHEDMRVRQKAQFELVKRDDDGLAVFEATIKQTDHQLARVHAIWGISQFARKELKHAALLVPLLKDQDPEIRAQAAKWIGDVRYKQAGDQLIELLKDEYARARFFAAEALGRTEHVPAVEEIIEMLRANNDEDAYLRHAGSLALARIGKAEPIVALSTDQSRAVRIAAVVALRRMRHEGIKNFLNDQDEFVVTEAARAINDDLNIDGALPALGDLLATTKFTNEALIRRSINANLEVGTDKAMQNLVGYAQKDGAPVAMRAEAIDALSTWSKPSVLDRVDGRYRGEITRNADEARLKLSSPITQLINHKEKEVRLHAVQAIAKLHITQASEPLLARLKTDKDASVRVEALGALAEVGDKNIGQAIRIALADNDKNVRITGLDLLAKADMPQDVMVSLLSNAINTKTTEEKQQALLTLGSLPVANSKPVFDQLLSKMEKGSLSPDVYLELSEALDSTKSDELINRYRAITSKLSPDSLAGAYRGTLMGGDPERGARIFFRNETAQCMRCHSYNDFGGNAGPRLNGVGARLTREQLLEALIMPSKRIAPGFGTVTVSLKDGSTVSGILQQEKPEGVVLKIADKPDTLIAKDQIEKRSQPASSMPPMHLLLTKKQIRDLVAFLETQKKDE